ncbi:hypothetical protein KDL01_22745 [Actinospica durhamensis]|uniref:FtsX-like permease family protein n=1 Tax=Actinospica durhamensis TaxID=1508375 RepID=A0A941ITL3_9ACTN|nr:FtsX-like permease family protein [Actinospica durhamensis]MBR7836113.1 hypothetical protein [Actinospica durhamensis]
MRIRPLLKAALLGWRRPATVALALVAAACAAGACTTARADLAARSSAFAQLMAASPQYLETVTASVAFNQYQYTAASITSGTFAASTQQVYDALEPDVPLAPRAQAWGSVVNNGHPVQDAPVSIQPPHWNAPMLTLGYTEDYQLHARLVAGRWPTEVKQNAAGVTTAEIAVTQATMSLLHVSLGSTLDNGISPTWPDGLIVRVVGVIAPVAPLSAFWASTGVLQAPSEYTPGPGSPPNWDLGAFVGPSELASGVLDDWDAQVTWTMPVDTAMTADQGAALQRNLNFDLTAADESLDHSAEQINGVSTQYATQIGPLLLAFVDAQAAAELQTAMPEAGLGAIALLALVLLLRWTIVVRHAETETLRARGASLRWLAARAAGESALVILPIGAVGWAIGVLPHGTLPSALRWISALLPLLLPAAVGLWTFLLHRALDRRGVRRANHAPRTAGYRTARRAVLFLTVAALCLLSLQQAHAHGLSPVTGIDAVSALSPIAAAGLATLAAAALAPPAIRMLLPPIRSRRGVVALLGLTRMTRVPGPALVILLVLSLALCTADLAVALARTPVRGSGAAASSTAADAAQAGLLMHHALGVILAVLAALAVATACLVVALVALGDAAERRASAARLSVMGLTGAQQRSLTLTELAAPLALACVCASLTATPLLWVVRPALTQGFTGDPRMTWVALALPVLIVVPAALATGLAGAGLARRGPAGSLRRGDYAEGI